MSAIEQKLTELGIVLQTPPVPVATYAPAVKTGSLLIISGQLPLIDGQLVASGKLGDTVDVKTAVAAARACFINVLSQARTALDGDLDRIARVVRLGGFVASTPNFTQQATVMNGASDLAVEIFGDKGQHARSTIGVAALPLDAAVEVEAMFEIRL